MIVDENGMCTLSDEDCSYHSRTVKQTNADRIRSMTDEELAEWMAINTDCFFCKVKNKNICSLDDGTCAACWLDCLKGEAKP